MRFKYDPISLAFFFFLNWGKTPLLCRAMIALNAGKAPPT